MIIERFRRSRILVSMIFSNKTSSKIYQGMIFAALLSSFICLGMNDDVSAASLTLTIPSSPVTLNLTPSASGTFTKSNANTISVKSDAYFGYTLTIKGKSSDNSLISSTSGGGSGGSSNNKITSITSSITENDFKTNTSYNNKWGYAPSKLYNTDSQTTVSNTNFLPGPTSISTNTIDKTTSPNDSSVNNYTLTIAAKVDSTVPSGKYSNNITLAATANTVSYNISYDLQAGENGPSPNPQTGNTINTSVKLSNTTPAKENYEFKGWCTVVPTANSTTSPSCTGATYQPDANYPLTNSINTVTLYAIWKTLIPTTMQNFGTYCNSLAEHQTLTLSDTRDSNTYVVSKLKDGKCWMAKNLFLGDGTIKSRTLTPDDSDVSSSYVLPASSSSGFTSSSTNSLYVNSTSGYYSYNVATAESGRSISSGNAPYSICAKGWRLPTKDELDALARSYSTTQPGYNEDFNSTTSKNLQQKPVPGMVIVGGYTSGSLDYSSQGFYWASTAWDLDNAYNINLRSSSVDSIDYTNDPKYWGWPVRCIARTPGQPYTIHYNLNNGTGGPEPNPQTGFTDEYSTLMRLSSTRPTREGKTFIGWCTNNPGDSSSCSGTKYPLGGTYDISNGADITLYATWVDGSGTMQDFDYCSGLSEHEVITLIDTRDSNEYNVAKLKDGKCWMVENIRIGSNASTTLLTPDDSNVNSNFTLPQGALSGFSSNDAIKIYIDPTWGGYYTWRAATVGSSLTAGNTYVSVCPKGWHLPNTTESQNMADRYGSSANSSAWKNALMAKPAPNWTLSGCIYDSTMSELNSDGNYWLACSTRDGYGCSISSIPSDFSRTSESQYWGFPVRCMHD